MFIHSETGGWAIYNIIPNNSSLSSLTPKIYKRLLLMMMLIKIMMILMLMIVVTMMMIEVTMFMVTRMIMMIFKGLKDACHLPRTADEDDHDIKKNNYDHF